jgi:hypothetical protein
MWASLLVLLLTGVSGRGEDAAPRMPMPIDFEKTANWRWLNKKVLDSRLLDDMEDLSNWFVENTGAGAGEMSLTAERSRDGRHALRLRSKTNDGKPAQRRGSVFGSVSVIRRFSGEDWSRFNRISVWVYPDLPGFRVVSLLVRLRVSGQARPPGLSSLREEMNYTLVDNHRWNQVVFEIAHLERSKVTGVELQYRLQGNEPEASDTVTFDFDQLELQRVEPDHYEGWNVAPGRIAFSHIGYDIGATKIAMGTGLEGNVFQVIRLENGQVVLTKPMRTLENSLGRFNLLDFSEVRIPGTYVLRAGATMTPAFRIADNVWTGTLWKALNFFFVQRCGADIPGSHRVCHRDWQAIHGDKRLIINGGWHDAGDLSQSIVNTSEAAYAMFSLARHFRERGEEAALVGRAIEEGRWGLDWLRKTTFGDGYRATWSAVDHWTNGVIGDFDDVVTEAVNSPFENLLAASAEAMAYRVLADSDPDAPYILKLAEEDWRFGMQGLEAITGRYGNLVELVSTAILASLDLAAATGNRSYAERAASMADIIVNSQQRSYLPELDVPLTGFFYTNPRKDRLLHYHHRGHAQAPLVALARLCDTLPEHKDWMRWYSAVALHSEYLKAISGFTEPFAMLPASIYRDDEYLQAPEANRASFQAQVLNGIKLGARHYLRLFPVWFGARGNNGVILSQAKGLSVAARLRGDAAAVDLVRKQLEWIVGRNPFAQSLMTGEGYDFTPLYSAMSGDIAGALPVGIQTRFNLDLPYWPPANCYTYKEVWVHAVSRWIWILSDLAGPALVEGALPPGAREAVEFRERSSGWVARITPDSNARFRAKLPDGEYEIRFGKLSKQARLLPGLTYWIDMLPERHLDFAVSAVTGPAGHVTLRVLAEGCGRHRLELRCDNLLPDPQVLDFELQPGERRTISVAAKVVSSNAPWVAVVIPDGNLRERKEVVGGLRGKPSQ